MLITGTADKGKCIGKTESGQVVFVEGVAPGDVVDVLILRKRKGFLEGRLQNIKSLSKERVEPVCKHFGVCGGCKWQHIPYEAQLRHKNDTVKNALQRIGKVDVEAFEPILGAAETEYYRNKLEFTFSCKRWLEADELNEEEISNRQDVLGFHRPRVFDKIIDIDHCHLQPAPSNEIRLFVKEKAKELGLSFFDIRENQGYMRNLLIRTSSLGETMVVFSFHEDEKDTREQLLDAVWEKFELTSLCYTINTKKNDSWYGLDVLVYKGEGVIHEQLGDVKYKISPKSFFQTNTRQAKELYDIVVEFAGMTGHENVYDLYTGTGSIACYVAKSCKQVVGIEEVEAAIVDAGKNAAMNGIENTVFYAGDVKDILTDQFAEKHGKPDILITDPPRAGMHKDVIEMLLKLASPKVVYVSCNPATQARDLNLLSEKYEVKKVRPVDMFPHTHHIESVALLQLKD